MDNAATSFPKPKAVITAMTHFAQELGASPGRGAYRQAQQAGDLLNTCRSRINTLIGGSDPNHVIFTLNTTDALNMAIRGVLKSGDHVITTALDHNSILRPLNELQKQLNITYTRIPCHPITGLVNPQDIKNAITEKTKLIAIGHGSNVSGTLQKINEIGQIAKESNTLFLVDAAQTIGHYPLKVDQANIDLLAFPGHKGLMGPLGTGILYIRPGVEKQMQTYREGGTGSASDQDTQPTFMPDRFEPGSHNAIGIIGLSESVKYILDKTVETLWQHEQKLVSMAISCLTDYGNMPGLTIQGPQTVKDRCGVFSIRIKGIDNPQDLSDKLENEYGILSRSGIHCAPHAHKTFNTHNLGGSTRISFGAFLTSQDVKFACDAIGQICFETAEKQTTNA